MDSALAELVRLRAANCCEYCRLPATLSSIPFEIDHIIARKHGGQTTADNLALSCFYCNSHKGPNIAGLDPQTKQVVRLYHPRNDTWEEHFRWEGAWLRGITAAGHATLEVLGINTSDLVLLRASLIREGLFPP
jgi:5-methylcytosine-specific restriction endonuclease McrA